MGGQGTQRHDITELRQCARTAEYTDVDERWVLIDRDTGLHVGWYFWLRLLDEVGRSDRYGSPFGLLVLERQSPSPRAAHEGMSKIAGAIRGTDLGGLIAPRRAAAILTEQEPAAAALAAERIVERLGGGVGWTQTLLCYPRDAAEITHLLTVRAPERATA